MLIYNCVVVFNKDKEKILFCKRRKEPYKGLYNFVGGKKEKDESSDTAAYRELYEETGIRRDQIRLFRFMDIRYYHPDFLLELYAGVVEKEITLREEINPLIWLPVSENFTDSSRFAGEQNIAHIVNVALQFPISQKTFLEDGI